MKSIVTGGAGFIGSHIVDALVERGDEVHVVDTYVAGKFENRINPKAIYHEVDVRDYDNLAPIIAGAAYVFHEAALPRVQFSIEHPLETFSVNVNGMVSVLRAAHEGGVRKLVNASSGSSVYGDEEAKPLSEDILPRPTTPYALQKYMSELTCKLWSGVYGLPTVSLRYFNVYGPRMDSEGGYALAIPKFLAQKSRGEPITIWGDGTHSRDFTHVRDVVRANLLAAESAKTGAGDIIHIGAGHNVSVNELAAAIGGPVVHTEARLEPAHARADITKAKELLGWEPTIDFKQGIEELKKMSGMA